MSGRIPDETLQAIRERVSIVEVVSGYVSLKKAGRNHLGLCPFHTEKTPSFTVSDERGLFHCFGCGAGGTVFTFLMRIDRSSFRDAVEALAKRAGVPLPAATAGPDDEARRQLLALNETAQTYYREMLRGSTGAAARAYLARRGVNAVIIEQYGLGCCPRAGGLARRIPAAITDKAISIGLLGRRDDGKLYDRLWGRVTFPIRDGSGRIVGFGGRTIEDQRPKYLNSPESPLFHKGHVLYGLFEARDAIRHAERVVVVEGYLDALSLVQAGIAHAVASLGTALTAAQLRLARRFAPEVVAFFDGDRAGYAAATRAFEVCLDAGVWGHGAFLPQGTDPDSYVRQHGVEATRALLDAMTPLSEFFLQQVDPGAGAPMPARVAAAHRVAQVIGRVRDPIQFDLLARQAADRLGIDETIFRGARPAAAITSVPAAAPIGERLPREEIELLEAVALSAEAAKLVADSEILDAFSTPALADAGRQLLAVRAAGSEPTAVVDRLPSAVATRIAAALLGEGAVAAGDPVTTARDCIRRIEHRRRNSQHRELRAMLKEADADGNEDDWRAALERANELIRRREFGA